MDKIEKAPQVIAKVTRGIGYTRIEAERAGRLAYAKARVIRSVAAQLRYALRYALPTN